MRYVSPSIPPGRIFPSLFLAVWLLAFPALAGETMSIQVRKADARATPSFLAPLVASLPYGTAVEVLEERGDWRQVSGNGKTGWLHVSALAKGKIDMKAGATDAAAKATSDELALAGKGFNRQVENQFKRKNPHLDYAWLDRMEGMTVDERAMETFLREGGLAPEGGAR